MLVAQLERRDDDGSCRHHFQRRDLHMSTRARFGSCIAGRSAGFTLIEIMVALIVTSIGLLGIAKLQALAYASTGSAAVRSLVALQAAGLAASMHVNRSYWAAGA